MSTLLKYLCFGKKIDQMQTFIVKFQLLLMIQTLGIKCFNTSTENTTLFVDNGDTFVLNCTCFSEGESSWKGPDGNDTVLTAYSAGVTINPYFNVTNIVIYGNYTIGKCHLKIENYSTANDGIYECSYIRSDRPQLKIIRSKNKPIIEGESVKLCCFSTSNPPVHYMAWYQNHFEVHSWNHNPSSKFKGPNTEICLAINPAYRNSTGNYACFAKNTIAKSNSVTVINVLYPPDVKVTDTLSEQSIILHCIPNGNPENYIFYDWQHKSEFNEHIRYIHGTPEGQLIIQTHQSRKTNQVDGIYVCEVSNGVSNLEGNFNQEGQTLIKSHASPVFVAENKPIQAGKFGRGVEIKVTIYDKLYNSTVLISNNGTTLKVKPTIENITTHDTFYGVNVRVTGIQYIFQLFLTSTNNFTNYTVEACNDVGCNYFYVQVISLDFNNKPQKYCNSGWKIVGILFGGILIISIWLNIYCLLKRKSLSRMVPEIPLEMQHDEIGNNNDNHASILALSNSVQEAVTSVDGQAVEETDPHSTPLEHNGSSDNSVQSLSTSLLSGDGYEHPYQSIDPADIEIHPYSTVGSYLYQNTIIFPKQISSRNPND